MGWMILIGVLFLIVVRISIEWLSEYLTYSTSKKEEREDAYISRTHAPKLRTTSSFAISCILIVAFIVGTIIISFEYEFNLS